MSWTKIFAVVAIICLVLGIIALETAVAGEKVKYHGTGFVTETKQIEVGDEEGHILMISKQKQLYINEMTGDKIVSTSVSTMDLNPKMNQFSLKGSGWAVDKNGDKIMREFEGGPAGKGRWKGTWKYVRGTGKNEGITGGGTWESFSMGQGQPSYIEVLGEVDRPQ